MYFTIITTGALVSSLQDSIGTSVWNHPHKKGHIQWSQLHQRGSSRVTTVLYAAGQKCQKCQKRPKLDFLIVIKGMKSYLFSPTNQMGILFGSQRIFLPEKITRTILFFCCIVLSLSDKMFKHECVPTKRIRWLEHKNFQKCRGRFEISSSVWLESIWKIPKSRLFVIFNSNLQSSLTFNPKTDDTHKFCVAQYSMNGDWNFSLTYCLVMG